MSEHVYEWLNAYYDGELQGQQLRKVEAHLEECPECRAELEGLQSLSLKLQESPLPEFPAAERFAARVGLQLPREQPVSIRKKVFEFGWWGIPVTTLLLLLFLQITFILSSWLGVADSLGLLGEFGNWVEPGSSSLVVTWSARLGLMRPGTGIGWLAAGEVFGRSLLSQIVPQLFLAIFYLGWLLVWWMRHNRQAGESSLENKVQMQ
ncbi:MAG: zf-HC2 domain-containing protein [Anaerolineales bacterium]|nr:zf-HC2 domain-containing protein [Anaerolineales bacterium]